ncbi:HNH endonuclease [Aerolutibacter ruishenii]|uniref:5-methylcytosine-specific restriction protein A n=1 Tax=Aerolutibacter ruishenii TaxID=686800 RepID=A0A562LYI7_9GAMM|nr:HNH endonuclease signature motif containing protein [Lysobacter ruishenii]TWI12711.1 5-methylcytosine-specific restriction protein A [Lysobacter ruishenii]
MGKLKTLKPRIGALPPRLKPVQADRQATRQYATNSAPWLALRLQVLLRDAYTCQTCGRVCGRKGEAHVDHRDGDSSNNHLTNLQTLCAPCHSRKTCLEMGANGHG